MRRASTAALRGRGRDSIYSSSSCTFQVLSGNLLGQPTRGITTVLVGPNMVLSAKKGVRHCMLPLLTEGMAFHPTSKFFRPSRSQSRLFSRTLTTKRALILPSAARTSAYALSFAGGVRLLLRGIMPRLNCQAQNPFNMDKFFKLSDDLIVTKHTSEAAQAQSKRSYGWCVTIAAWAKYLFGLGLALVGSFAVWYLSGFQRPIADRFWRAFIFGALPMLAAGYVGRVVATFLCMGSAGYGAVAAMSYWETKIVNKSVSSLNTLLVNRADVREMIGDWGSDLRPHLDSFEITTNLLHFATEPNDADFPRAINGFVFALPGSEGEAIVRVLAELNFEDKEKYEEQVTDFFEEVENYSYGILSFLQPFAKTPGPYPSIPQFQIKGVDIQYADICCVAGPKAGRKIVLVDNMHKLANVKRLQEFTNKPQKEEDTERT